MSQLLILLAVIFLIPLPLLVISGMEYTLDLFFSFLFIASFSGANFKVLPRNVYVYGLLMVTTSYETIPILLIACMILLTRRQGWSAFKLFFLSLLPVYLFGLYALTKHNYFIPNPILLNWSMPSLHNSWQDLSFVLTIVLICFLMLTVLRQQGWKLLLQNPRRPWLIYALMIIPATPMAFRSITSFSHARQSCVSVYDEQCQAAKFIRAYYYDDNVASNEIGAVSFWSDRARILDLAGIGDLEVLRSIRTNSWTPARADSFAEKSNSRIVVLHHSWRDKDTAPYWYKIASWQISTDSISFYSVNAGGIPKLQKGLHDYERHLPADVTVRYY
jgi:hypothetical protein